MSAINFFSEDVSFVLKQKRVIRQWINHICTQYGQEIDSVNFIYCSDNYLLKINQDYLDHDYFTDIITFDEREDLSEPITADIFISVDRVKDNAKTVGTTFTQELHRVMIHGMLHMLGEDDKTEAAKQQMRKSEEASLSLLKL
ncbi:rRNA maturation RNase YbeY [Roseivirga pacifica]|uniref:rRNA maturation RNase YbeY n=1 Tax=Roseivirga pacifica TaxID=1267423 RepID=UPI00227BC2AE|nr:rRNA maturation RNase YbeY [Roseivirga pacifica]